MITFIILAVFAVLVGLGMGIFALLNWQMAPIVWAQPIVFIIGCLELICVGVLITTVIIIIKESK